MPPHDCRHNAPFRLLILGGTAGARQLAARLQPLEHIDVMLSLAGRTQAPVRQPVPVRTGGFGGSHGLEGYLRNNQINALIVATHPFAARMAEHAALAAQASQTPLIRLLAPAWQPHADDHWQSAPSMEKVPELLGASPQRVLLTIGRQQLAPFERAPQHHYVIRSVEELPTSLSLPDVHHIKARGPFSLISERLLMQQEGIDVVVTKNSGSQEVAAKLTAARHLGIRVIMVERPATPAMREVSSPEAVIDWVNEHVNFHQWRGE